MIYNNTLLFISFLISSIAQASLTTDSTILVAVIDSGVAIQHPSIKNSIWSNPGEMGIDNKGRDKRTNGLDDDGNGYIDDVHGWDFVSQTASVTDNHGHGTHIAGIIVGSHEASDIRGFKVKVLPLKYYDPGAGSQNIKTTVQAIEYAIKMGVDIINYSSGGRSPSYRERLAIEKAGKKGILFVTAAGNDNSNIDRNPFFPGSYSLPNMITVGALNKLDNRLPASNYGKNTVDILATGEKIVSALPRGKYGPMSGTSQATAFVTRAAAQYMFKSRVRDPKQVKQRILSSGAYSKKWLYLSKKSSRLDAKRVLFQLSEREDAMGVPIEEYVSAKRPWVFNN